MTTRPGFIALISVLIMSALALLVGVSVLSGAAGDLNIAMTDEQRLRAQAAATFCAERALMRLKQSSSYAGNETVVLPNGDTCRILPLGGVGNVNRTVHATSTVSGATRKISISVLIVDPVMRITSWQEVADF